MAVKLIDFGIDFIKILKIYSDGSNNIIPLQRVIEIRKFNGENLQIQLSNKFDHVYFNQTFKIDKFLLHDFCFDYPLLQDFYNSIQNYFMIPTIDDLKVTNDIMLIVKKRTRAQYNERNKQFNYKQEILLNDLIYKVQDMEVDFNFRLNYDWFAGNGIKYFLYNKEQNRTITLYDHQVKFIQENFNKT